MTHWGKIKLLGKTTYFKKKNTTVGNNMLKKTTHCETTFNLKKKTLGKKTH